MNITIHHSGSSGNLYQVDDLLIEAGVPIKQIKKDLDYKLSGISGCLVSHFHGDHAMATKDIMKAGIDCYCSQDTANEMGLSGHRLHIINHGQQIKIGGWIVKAFNLVHDVPCLGFLLAIGKDRLLYANDTSYIPYRFNGLTHIMLGVNYDTETLVDNITCGYVNPEVGKRMLKNHMSLDTAKGFFTANDMSQVEEVHLIHLSDSNSNAEKFKHEIQMLCGRPVYIA
ncbi:MAG: MBL fold metallo-hydrolase [Candidatus Atribacteria bacterium]|nr:MBL fold metallo-hydrolase [Candidatus Atribacteria bacterium]